MKRRQAISWVGCVIAGTSAIYLCCRFWFYLMDFPVYREERSSAPAINLTEQERKLVPTNNWVKAVAITPSETTVPSSYDVSDIRKQALVPTWRLKRIDSIRFSLGEPRWATVEFKENDSHQRHWMTFIKDGANWKKVSEEQRGFRSEIK